MITTQQVSQLFITILNRVVDSATMKYWTQKETFNPALVNSFLTEQADAQSKLDTKAFIQLAYKNALGKTTADDPEGMQWWEDQMNANQWSKADFIVQFLHTIDLYRNGTIVGSAAEKQAVSLFDVKFALGIYASDTLKEDFSGKVDSLTFGKGLTDITASNLTTALGAVQTEIAKLGGKDTGNNSNNNNSGSSGGSTTEGDSNSSQKPDDNTNNSNNTESNDNGGINWSFGTGGSDSNESQQSEIEASGVNPYVPTDSPIA